MTGRSIHIVLVLTLLMWMPGFALADSEAIVLTKKEIEIMNANSICDILNQIPGLKCSVSSLSIRGSYNVMVMLDGRPVNDPSSSIGAIKWDLVSIDNIEKIEIHIGSGSLKFGSDAGAGVVILTSSKIRNFSGNVKVSAGNYGAKAVRGNLLVKKKKLGIGITPGYESTKGYLENNDKIKKILTGKTEYLWNEKNKLIISAGLIEEKKGLNGSVTYPTPGSRKESRMESYVLDFAHQSKQFTRSDNSETIPSRRLADFRMEYQKKRLTLFGLVKNLTDKSYMYSDDRKGSPRTYQAGVNYKF